MRADDSMAALDTVAPSVEDFDRVGGFSLATRTQHRAATPIEIARAESGVAVVTIIAVAGKSI
jgi:hypothetical protein